MKMCANDLSSFYASGVFSDLIVTCKGHEWKVHKFQVCGQSDFFYKACSGQFKVRLQVKSMGCDTRK